RAGPGNAADLSDADGPRESRGDGGQSPAAAGALDARSDPCAVSAIEGARAQSRRDALRRRAADAGDRPCADDESAAPDPRRGDRRPGADGAPRNLELPRNAASG